ncbi:RTJK polymerase, partial [Acromyrmex charruanus]
INGLLSNKKEVLLHITANNLDIVLISETHTANKVFTLRGFHVYSTHHPDGTTHGGSAIIIKNIIKHYVMAEYRTEQISLFCHNLHMKDLRKEIKVELDNVHSTSAPEFVTHTVISILHEQLGIKKLSARWVPRLLTVDHKRDRMTISKQCLEMFQRNPDEFLRRFIIVDETWIHYFTPETKEQSTQLTSPSEPGHNKRVKEFLNSDLQLSSPLKLISSKEIQAVIKRLPPKKAPGFDFITSEVLKQLPRKGLAFLVFLFNGIIRTSCFPDTWKVSQIIML